MIKAKHIKGVNSNGYVLTTDGSGVVSWQDSTPIVISDADGDTKIQVEESNDEDIVRFDTNGEERIIITSAGKVGIGVSTPSRLLDINGDLVVRGGDIHGNATGDPAISVDSSTNASIPNNLSVGGTTTLNSLAYTWPASQSADRYLKTNGSGTLSWDTVSSGSSYSVNVNTPTTPNSAVSLSYSSSNNEEFYIMTPSADITVTLPSISGNSIPEGYKVNVKNLSASNTLTLSPNSTGSNKIDGSASITHSISTQYENITLVCDGSDTWYRV